MGDSGAGEGLGRRYGGQRARGGMVGMSVVAPVPSLSDLAQSFMHELPATEHFRTCWGSRVMFGSRWRRCSDSASATGNCLQESCWRARSVRWASGIAWRDGDACSAGGLEINGQAGDAGSPKPARWLESCPLAQVLLVGSSLPVGQTCSLAVAVAVAVVHG
jgi:hypothetical protein